MKFRNKTFAESFQTNWEPRRAGRLGALACRPCEDIDHFSKPTGNPPQKNPLVLKVLIPKDGKGVSDSHFQFGKLYSWSNRISKYFVIFGTGNDMKLLKVMWFCWIWAVFDHNLGLFSPKKPKCGQKISFPVSHMTKSFEIRSEQE